MTPEQIDLVVPHLGRGEFFGPVVAEADTPGLSVREVQGRPATGVPRHSHEHAHFCLVISGAYETTTSNLRGSCARLTLLYHPAGTTHDDHMCSPSGRTLMVSLEPDVLESFGDPPLLDRSLALAEEELGFPGSRVRREIHESDGFSALSIEGLVLEMVERVLERTEKPDSRVPDWLGDATAFLRDNASKPARVADVANAAGVHPVHLARVFRRHLGVSPGEYLRRVRVEAAMALVEFTSESLATVAFRAGFCDQSELTKAFRRELSTTPAAYRRAVRH